MNRGQAKQGGMDGGKQSEMDEANERGKQTERGQDDERGSGHGRQRMDSRHTACRTALQADTASGLSARLRPHNKRTAHSWPAAQQEQQLLQMTSASRRAGKWGECSGTATKAGADLPNLSLPHLTPLPVTVPTHSLNLAKPNLAPN